MKFVALVFAIFPTFAFASSSCPTYIQSPTHALCATSMNVGGVKLKKTFIVPLSSTGNFKEFSGELDFEYPGASIQGGKENKLSVLVEDSTHGNSETCPSTQSIESHMDILGEKVDGGRKTFLLIDDGAFELRMNCILK